LSVHKVIAMKTVCSFLAHSGRWSQGL